MVESPTDIDSDEFELERAYDRPELAAVFREFADALDEDRPVRLDNGERALAVAIPERVVAEVEAERDDDAEPPVAELELELEWDDPDGTSFRLEDSERETPGIAGADVSADREGTDEEPTDSGSATMPPEGVTGESGSGSSTSTGDEAESAGESGSERSPRTSRFEVYEDRGGEWRWRLVHWNGNIVADSGEGYASRSNAKRAARSVMRSAPTARVVDRED